MSYNVSGVLISQEKRIYCNWIKPEINTLSRYRRVYFLDAGELFRGAGSVGMATAQRRGVVVGPIGGQ